MHSSFFMLHDKKSEFWCYLAGEKMRAKHRFNKAFGFLVRLRAKVIMFFFCLIPANSVSLDQLDQQLERSIENVRQIQIIVSDFQQQGQPGLNQKLQNIVKDLQEIDKIKPSLQDIQVSYLSNFLRSLFLF